MVQKYLTLSISFSCLIRSLAVKTISLLLDAMAGILGHDEQRQEKLDVLHLSLPSYQTGALGSRYSPWYFLAGS